MGTDSLDNQEPRSQEDSNPKVETNIRLQAWVKERPFIRYGGRHARQRIADSIKVDMETPSTLQDRSAIEKQILFETEASRARVDGMIPQSGELSVESKDKTYITRFRRESGALVAEEVKPVSFDVISQARIFGDGRTELTLNYTGPKYEDRENGIDRNPRIIVSKDFPKATATVFNLLVGTLK